MLVGALACLLSMTWLTAHAAPFSETAPPTSVYVMTAERGYADDLSARQASVKDLVAVLGKKKSLTVVATEEDADVIVEVLSRASSSQRVVIGVGPRPGQTTAAAEPRRSAVLKVRITRSTESAELTNKNKPNDNPNGWRSAADDLAGQIEKWIKERPGPDLRQTPPCAEAFGPVV